MFPLNQIPILSKPTSFLREVSVNTYSINSPDNFNDHCYQNQIFKPKNYLFMEEGFNMNEIPLTSESDCIIPDIRIIETIICKSYLTRVLRDCPII